MLNELYFGSRTAVVLTLCSEKSLEQIFVLLGIFFCEINEAELALKSSIIVTDKALLN
jgi:hypothetical protein